MVKISRLPWRQLVDTVRGGEFEPRDALGNPVFMYSQSRNVFISDETLIKQVLVARKHKHSFMLIGEFGTGKNVFLELVARGDSGDQPVTCIDENVNGTQEEMLDKFFGPAGLVEQHPGSLFHFDLLQNAVNWPAFLDKVHELARKDVLYRTDGKVIRNLGIRVVGGATVELQELVSGHGASSAKYLYDYLATNQLARTPRLVDQRKRISTVLSEVLASQILDPMSQISESDVAALEEIPDSLLDVLEHHLWPDGFYEIVRLVRTSLVEGRWMVDSVVAARMTPLKAFISFSLADLGAASRVREWLAQHNVEPWISVDRLLPGQDWELEINKALHATDVVILCLTEASVTKQGYVQTEIRRALEFVDRMPEGEIYLIPIRLEPCDPPFRITKYQYVDFYEAEGRNKLLLALRNRAATLGKAPPGSGHYTGMNS